MPTDFKRELVDYILAKSDKEAVMQVNAAIAQWNSIVGEYEFKIQNSRFTPPRYESRSQAFARTTCFFSKISRVNHAQCVFFEMV